MKTVRILWVFNAIMSLVPIYFFFAGLADGTVSSDNIGIWAIILIVIAGVIGGSYWLKENNHLTGAKIILIIAAIPSVIVLIFFLSVILSNTRWN